MNNSLLFDEHPLVILPMLAREIGLNEAIVLQQVHYWIVQNERANRNYHDGYYWTFNSYPQWQKQFPFWSLATVRRTMASLEKSGHLVIGRYNQMAGDRSKWYRIDYSRSGVSTPPAQNEHPSDHNEHTPGQNEQVGVVKMSAPIPETIQRLTKETISTTGDRMVDALMNLPYWKPESESDTVWLAEFSLDFPEFSEQHIKECRDFNDGRRARHKGDWKNRLRNWMKVSQRKERDGTSKQRTRANRPDITQDAKKLAQSWGQ